MSYVRVTVDLQTVDCNSNGLPDGCDVASGTSPDCNGNNAPDECDISSGASSDCNGNQIPDECDLADGTGTDCKRNGALDDCDILADQAEASDACSDALLALPNIIYTGTTVGATRDGTPGC